MTTTALIAYSAACSSGALALAVLVRRRFSAVTLCFSAGLLVLALETLFATWSAEALPPNEAADWKRLALIARAFVPGIWLCFSFIYARGHYREFLQRWRVPLLCAGALPVIVALGFVDELIRIVALPDANSIGILKFGRAGNALSALHLVASILVLTNLEKTFRAAVGSARWRIKFVVLGLAALFGARIYTGSQALLFSSHGENLVAIEAAALLVGCAFIAVAYWRRGFADIDVYPSRAVLQNSFTILFAGAYLLVVGVLAQIVRRLGGAESFPLHALLVLVASVFLAAILLSERFRHAVRNLVSRHFRRPRQDYRKVWMTLTQRVSNLREARSLCLAAAQFISETFGALSVTIWLLEEAGPRLVLGGSTLAPGDAVARTIPLNREQLAGLGRFESPLDLERQKDAWAEKLRESSPRKFKGGGHRFCVPLLTGERRLGFILLADRVRGAAYSQDELDLLSCIASQLGSDLLNLRLTNELLESRELDAFEAVSSFFAHDLKNAASSLSLMIQNLREHFDEPEFREDAIRGLGHAVHRINRLIERAARVREQPEMSAEESDLNQLVEAALENLGGLPGLEVVCEMRPVPPVLADRDHLQSVVTNLLVNAREAVNGNGQIRIETRREEGRAILSLADNGCGMSDAFLRESLFRPFQTTKKKGLGIGLFQARRIVLAHGGSIVAQSEPDRGTTFVVTLPLKASSL